eukprot:TRINITY_DN32329_c0_g1_i1.p1 TRINITY_DN32329_c0_g1~~TRINITY_DN32329_c0_g1_i1.p1  ORF type:complete len:434 (+),score=172.61 TRINITY_DN32329_c0_g1_i1:3-1304(+)
MDESHKNKIEAALENAKERIARAFGDDCSDYKEWELKVDFDALEKSQHACNEFTRSSCYYTIERFATAVSHFCIYTDDRIVDAVAGNVKKVIFTYHEGDDAEKKSVEFDSHKITLTYTLDCNRSDDQFFSSNELENALYSAVPMEGKYLVSLLRGVCDNCYTRWGWYDRALYPFLKQEYIPQPSEKALAAGKTKDGSKSTWVFEKTVKQTANNKKKDKRAMHIVRREGFATCQVSGETFKEANYKMHKFSDFIAIDLYKLSSKLPGRKKMACTVWLRESYEKKSFWSKFGLGKFKPPMPSMDMPSVGMPSVPLPSCDLPSVSLPDVSMPSISMPSLSLNMNFLRREKEPRPRRDHPATMKTSEEPYHHLTITTHDLSAKEDNILIQAFAWVLWGEWRSQHWSAPAPFYVNEKPAFLHSTTIDDNTPDVDDEED